MGAMAAGACYRGVEARPGVGEDDGAESGATDDGVETGGTEGGDLPDADLLPAPPTIHRLTQFQLTNTYAAVLGEPLERPIALPPDDLLYGFTSIAAATSTISPLAAEKYKSADYF